MIYRGTTPSFTIVLPEDYPVNEVTVAYFSISQLGKKVIEIALNDLEVDTDTNSITATLTQAQTLSLQEGYIRFQLRFVLMDPWATEEWVEEVKGVIKDGEI